MPDRAWLRPWRQAPPSLVLGLSLALGACGKADSQSAGTGGAPGGGAATGGVSPTGGTPSGGSPSTTGGTTGGTQTQTGGGGTGASGGNGGTTGGASGGSEPTGGASGGSGGTPEGGTTPGGAGATAGGQTSEGGSAGQGGSAGVPSSAVCPPGPYDAEPVPQGAMPMPVCTGFRFTEGVVWFADTNTIYFSDFVNDQSGPSSNYTGSIIEYSPGGECMELAADTGTNGLAIWTDGNILAARHLDQTVTIFDRNTGAATPLIEDYQGDPFSSPNDLTIRSDGNVYFTDPAYQVGNRDEVLPQAAYRRDPEGNLSVVEELSRPNGISLSPDESVLYVSRSSPNQVRAYDLDQAGAPSNGRALITSSGSDGMAVDCAGNLYLTSGGVSVFSPEGDSLGTLSAQGATNVAFGGPDRKTLYITAGTQLLAVDLNIPGFPY